MIVAPVLWSTAGVVTRHVEKAGPFELVFWRSLFALGFIFLFLALTRRNPVGETWKAGAPGLFSGAMWAIMFTAFMLALNFTSTANTLVVMSVSPLLTALLARLMLSDPLPGRTWAAIIVSTIGLVWMFGAGFAAHGARDIAGMAIALLVPVAAASNTIALRKVATRVDRRVDLVPAVMLGGAISCIVSLPMVFPFNSTPKDIALMAFLGVFQLGLPCMLLVLASRALLAPEIALLGLLEVVLGPLWAWLGAGEVPARATLLGGAVVIGALLFNELAGFRRIMAAKLSATRISG
jgi:drug/metabolite transporter (DMT)-like permease